MLFDQSNIGGLDLPPDYPLQESGSAGLAPLPSQGPDTFDYGIGLAQPSQPTQAQPAPAQPAPQMPKQQQGGIGLAQDDDRAYLKSLPTNEKIALALQAFGAGVNGQPDPVAALLDRRRKQIDSFRQEATKSVGLISQGMEAVRQFPPGSPERAAIIEQFARASGPNADSVRNALSAVGTADEAKVKEIASTLGDSAAMDLLVKASVGDPKKAQTLIADEGFMKQVNQRVDQKRLPAITGKMSVLVRTLESMPESPYKGADGKVSLDMAQLTELNGTLPKEVKLSEQELVSIGRNQQALAVYGLKTDKAAEKESDLMIQLRLRAEDRSIAKEERDAAAKQMAAIQLDGKKELVRLAASLRQEPAPTVTEVADPADPSKSIKIDAKTGRKLGDAPPKASGKALPVTLQKQLTEAAEAADATDRFVGTFKSTYGGKTITGGAGNVAGRIFGDGTGQTQWWQDYELHQSVIRNKLFGSALTALESEAWEKSAINPRMDAGEIKKNLARRATLENKAVDRLVKGAVAGGYSAEQVSAFTGRESAQSSGPVKVKSVEEARALKPGTKFIDPNGVERVR